MHTAQGSPASDQFHYHLGNISGNRHHRLRKTSCAQAYQATGTYRTISKGWKSYKRNEKSSPRIHSKDNILNYSYQLKTKKNKGEFLKLKLKNRKIILGNLHKAF